MNELQQIKVLLIEDNPGDVRLIREMLREQPSVRFDLEDRAQLSAGLELLSKENFDVVLLDLGLPDSQGLESLSRLVLNFSDIPVIVLTGHLGEEVGLAAVNGGAQDYLIKGQIDGNTLSRSMIYAIERNRTENQLRESEGRYRSLFENMIEGYAHCLMLFDGGRPADFIYLDVNKAFERLTGLKNVAGKRASDVIPGIRESDPGLIEIYGRVALTGRPERFEIYVTALGDWFSISVYSLKKEHFVAVFDVITERKKAEEALRESEARFSKVFHSSPVAIVVSSLTDGALFDVNDTFLDVYGYKREEITGRTSLDLQLWVNTEERLKMIGTLLEHGRVQNFEAKFRRKSGEIGELLISAELIELSGAQYVLGMFMDITERKRVQQERELTIEFLRIVTESTGTRALIQATATFFQNHSGCEAVGVRLHEKMDYPYYEARGFPTKFVLMESSLCAKDSEGRPVSDSAGNPVLECMCGNVIQGRFDPSKPFFTAHGSFWTNNTTELLRSTTEADRQSRTRNRCNGEGYESVALIPLRLGEQRLGLLQLNDRRKGMFSKESIASWERLADYLAVALVKFRTDEALRNSEEKYRRLVDNASVGIYKASLDGRFLYVNKVLATTFEFDSPEEMISEEVSLRYKNPDDRAAFLDELKKKGKVDNFELDTLSKSGKLIHLLISSTLEGETISGMVLNVTEQKKLEAQLRHAQKMEAIGQLAGGVAHDFNNILNVIIGYGTMVLDKMAPENSSKAHMNEVLAAADRAANLTKRLLAFSRKQPMEMKPVNVNETILGIEKMLSRIIGEDIVFATDLTDREMTVMADAGQIEQVLMNLASNARAAMPRGGRLTIGTEIKEVDKEFIESYGYGKIGKYALISVTDNGIGMDAETRRKIFEPFFTTKGVGEGTGLGLAMAYGIIKRHSGFINVYSEEGKGTTFKILLPLIDGEASNGKRAEADPIKGGTETILVAEDDASLRELTRLVLESFGYNVIIAVDGEDAINKYDENRDKIQFIILDMIMPKKSGKEAYEGIRKISPSAKALFISGYTMDIVSRQELLDKGMDFILKPFTPKDLLKKIREALER